MSLLIKCEWLADMLISQRDMLTQFWIESIRTEHIDAYLAISDEQLRKELPPTVDSMILAMQTGDLEGPRKHSFYVVKKRIADGFKLVDLQMSLHALGTAVIRLVKNANLGLVKECEALLVASNLYYLVALIAAAEYEQLRIEQQIRFATTYDFGITLSKSLDLGTILDIAVHKVVECFSGESVAILLAGSDGDRYESRAYHNLDESVAMALPDICAVLDCGLGDMNLFDMRETTHVIPDIRANESLGPWSELLASKKFLSMVCTPLIAKQRRLGALVIFWQDVHTSSKVEMDFLFAMTGHIANALHNAILYEEAKGKRELGILLDSSRFFASSLDMQDVLRRVAKMATETVRADLAVVSIPNRIRGHSDTAHYARTKARSVAHRIVEAVILEGEANRFGGLGSDFASGKPILYSNLSDFPGWMRPLAGIAGSVMVVPLRQKDMLLGALVLVSLAPNVFTEYEVSLASGLSDFAGVAIENARLYEYERNIAETLQRSFLPTSLPNIEGYEVAAYYRPAMAEAKIGGDFYDVFTTGYGNVSVVIGDVSGKGLKAAIPTAMGRYVVRAYAAENPLPSNVLMRLNRVFYENAPEGMFMTAFYGNLDPEGNVLTYVSAGHDPPLLYSSASNQVSEISAEGLCLGVVADAISRDKKIKLQPGDVLLLYTDGATDVKGDGNGDRLGIDGLKRLLLSTINGSAQQIVDDISNAIWSYCSGKQSDDVALVVLKRFKKSSSSADATLTVPLCSF